MTLHEKLGGLKIGLRLQNQDLNANPFHKNYFVKGVLQLLRSYYRFSQLEWQSGVKRLT